MAQFSLTQRSIILVFPTAESPMITTLAKQSYGLFYQCFYLSSFSFSIVFFIIYNDQYQPLNYIVSAFIINSYDICYFYCRPKNKNMASSSKGLNFQALTMKQPKMDHIQNVQIQNSMTLSTSNSANNFQALKKLKQTQQHLDMMRRRLSLLKVKQQKNNRRYQTNVKKLESHRRAQNLEYLQKQRKRQYQQQLKAKIQNTKQQNINQKLVHHKRIVEATQKLSEKKQEDFKKSKVQSKQIQQKIQQLFIQDLSNKKANAQKIKQLQEKSKKSIQMFHLNKKVQSIDKKFKQTDHLQLLKTRKDDQIKKMLDLEMQMIQRQSRSRVVMEDSSKKLKMIFNPQRSRSKNKNNSIQKQGKHNASIAELKDRSGRYSNQQNDQLQQNKSTFNLPKINSHRGRAQLNYSSNSQLQKI